MPKDKKLEELERKALIKAIEDSNGGGPGIVSRAKSALKSYFTPIGRPLSAMDERKGRLDSMPQNTGGMFDIIYKKRKEREKELEKFE